MILVLSRGGYCPKDRRQAEGLVQLHHEMEVGYSRLVTISTDNILLTNEYRTGAGAHWTWVVLRCDPVETLAGVAIGGSNVFAVCGTLASSATSALLSKSVALLKPNVAAPPPRANLEALD
jgi:hypothetical protein